jgi:hypothetical protein
LGSACCILLELFDYTRLVDEGLPPGVARWVFVGGCSTWNIEHIDGTTSKWLIAAWNLQAC